MAEYLRLITACVVSGALALPAAHAENLPDPTRPPAEFGSGANAAAAVASGPVLQSVYISAGRRSAIISGQTVKLGEKYGDARVVGITESEVVLQSGTVRQTLHLFPDVSKSPHATRSQAGKAENRK